MADQIDAWCLGSAVTHQLKQGLAKGGWDLARRLKDESYFYHLSDLDLQEAGITASRPRKVILDYLTYRIGKDYKGDSIR